MEKTSEKIVAFDSLRFLACVFVVLHHASLNICENIVYFRTSGLAVEVFFVLSGFLLANTYYKNLSRSLRGGE